MRNLSRALHSSARSATKGLRRAVAMEALEGRRLLTATLAVPMIDNGPVPASTVLGTAIADQASVSGGDNPTGTVTFDLYNNSTGAGTPLFTDTETLSGTSAKSNPYTACATGTDYWIATYNGDANNTAVSTDPAAAPVSITPLAPPTNLTVVSQTATSLTLSWTASTSSSVVAYNIYRDGVAINWVKDGLTTYTDAQIAQQSPGIHHYTVVAFDLAGDQSPQDAAVSVTVASPTKKPVAPTHLTLTSQTSSAISLSWTASASPTVVGYDIYRNGVAINWVGTGITTYTDSNAAVLSPGTYHYSIVAFDVVDHKSPKSAGLCVTIPSPTSHPAAPTLLKMTSLTSDDITLTWAASKSPCVVAYDVYRDGVDIDCIDTGTTTCTDSDLTTLPPGKHQYTVVAVNMLGNASRQSAPLKIVIPA